MADVGLGRGRGADVRLAGRGPWGGLNPTRKAIPVKGGYRVTGRTPFVSGAHEDSWDFGLARLARRECDRYTRALFRGDSGR